VGERRGGWMMRGRSSALTGVVAIGGLSLAALIDTLAMLEIGGKATATTVAVYGAVFVGLLAAAVIFTAAVRLVDRLNRSTWLFVGVSVALISIGDRLWAMDRIAVCAGVVEITTSELFYGAAYLVFALGLMRFALSFQNRVDFTWIATETVVMTAIVGATLWVTILAPATRSTGGLAPAVGTNLTYVFFDFPLLFAPALCVLIVAIRLRDRAMIIPWSAVAAGVVVTVLSDVAWLWERMHGSITAFGYMAANVLFAVGVMAALDAQTGKHRKTVAAE
jgi:hypothetical protein